MWRTLILIAIGGGIGSILRYLTSVTATKYFPGLFPWGTLIVNVLGCFVIGILIGLFDRQQMPNQDFKYLLITGFCGGFTTFSTFAAENINLFQSGNYLAAFSYTALSVIICLAATWCGMLLLK